MNKKIKERRKKEMAEEERCALPLCRGRTGVLKKTPIDKRIHYVQGCGQLCEQCANEMEREIELSSS